MHSLGYGSTYFVASQSSNVIKHNCNTQLVQFEIEIVLFEIPIISHASKLCNCSMGVMLIAVRVRVTGTTSTELAWTIQLCTSSTTSYQRALFIEQQVSTRYQYQVQQHEALHLSSSHAISIKKYKNKNIFEISKFQTFLTFQT